MERGVDQLQAETGDCSAGDCHIEGQQRGLDVQDVGRESGAKSLGVARYDFRRFVVQHDHRVVVRAGDHRAEQCRGVRLQFLRHMGKEFLRLEFQCAVLVQQRLALGLRLRAESVLFVGFRQRQRQKRRREGNVLRRLAPEIESVGQRAVRTQPRDLDLRLRVGREGRRKLTLGRAHFPVREYEQRAGKVGIRAFLVQDSRQLHGDFLQIAEAVDRLRQIVEPELAGLHRRSGRLRERLQIKIEGFVRQRHGFRRHGLMLEKVVPVVEVEIAGSE